ncbi:MAG: type IV pilus modification protein PilV [Vitreoscilla sp.]
MSVTVRRAPPPPNATRGSRWRAASLRVAGFSLVEVLVAMFVVAMGILALAGLLQAATRYSKLSELRSTATLLANDVADRIRANPLGGAVGTGGYDLTDKGFPSPPAAPHAPCTSAAPCGPVDLAQVDLADWTARVHATLPKGSAWIQFHAGRPPAPDYVDVWVGWADPLTLSPGVAADRPGTECPDAWKAIERSVRCVYLQVAL